MNMQYGKNHKQDTDFIDKVYPVPHLERAILADLFPYLLTDAERRLSDLRCELISDQDGTDTSMVASLEITDLF